MIMDMKVNIAGVELKNPVTVASGTFGSGEEFSEVCGSEQSWSCHDKRRGKCAVAGKSDTTCGRSLRRNDECDRTSESGN